MEFIDPAFIRSFGYPNPRFFMISRFCGFDYSAMMAESSETSTWNSASIFVDPDTLTEKMKMMLDGV